MPTLFLRESKRHAGDSGLFSPFFFSLFRTRPRDAKARGSVRLRCRALSRSRFSGRGRESCARGGWKQADTPPPRPARAWGYVSRLASPPLARARLARDGAARLQRYSISRVVSFLKDLSRSFFWKKSRQTAHTRPSFRDRSLASTQCLETTLQKIQIGMCQIGTGRCGSRSWSRSSSRPVCRFLSRQVSQPDAVRFGFLEVCFEAPRDRTQSDRAIDKVLQSRL